MVLVGALFAAAAARSLEGLERKRRRKRQTGIRPTEVRL